MTAKVNLNLDRKSLDFIKNRVSNNLLDADDLSTLDFYLSTVLPIKDYILNQIIRNGINSYEDYVSLKKNTPPDKDKLINGTLHGAVLAVISVLDDFLNKPTKKQ